MTPERLAEIAQDDAEGITAEAHDHRRELLCEVERRRAERDYHRETLRQLWTSPSFRDVYGGYIRHREPWLFEKDPCED